MRYTVHVVRGGQLYLVDCGLTNACATDLIQRLEAIGCKVQVDISGAASEPLNAPLCSLEALARGAIRVASLVSGRCAA